MMIKKKLAISIVVAVTAALSMGVGCKKDEESGDGDGDGPAPTECEALCDASSECGERSVCLSECADAMEACPSEVADYLACAEGKDDVMCIEVTALGISSSCIAEAAAIQLCALPPGDGDGATGGTQGDGDGDTGGTQGDGDGDTGGTTDLGGNGGVGGEGGAPN